MTLQVPEVVRQSWGDDVVVEFVPWLEQIVAEKAVPRDEYRQVLSRLEVLEHDVADVKTDVRDLRSEMNKRFIDLERHVEMRFDGMNDRFDQMTRYIEGRFDQMNERFDTRLDQMNERFDSRLDQMNERFDSRLDQMNERMLIQTRWLIGSIALFGTLITILMAIAQFTP